MRARGEIGCPRHFFVRYFGGRRGLVSRDQISAGPSFLALLGGGHLRYFTNKRALIDPGGKRDALIMRALEYGRRRGPRIFHFLKRPGARLVFVGEQIRGISARESLARAESEVGANF